MFNRSTLLRAAVIALGSALTIPALAQTDGIPLVGPRQGASYGTWTGSAATQPAGQPTGRDAGWNIANEPGFVPDARGAFGLATGRTPLAAVSPRATDAYGSALNSATN